VKDVNPAHGYAAAFIHDTAAIAWSGQQGNFTFVSDPASTSTSQFAALGKERNGRFFP
jgi:methylaspartate ammonia-lyase